MNARRPPEAESTEPNDPSVEAAFQAAPEERVAEILAGELHLSPRPAIPHAHVAFNLGGILAGPFKFGRGGPGGWIILAEPELHLGPRPDRVVPDLAGWRRERSHDLGSPGSGESFPVEKPLKVFDTLCAPPSGATVLGPCHRERSPRW